MPERRVECTTLWDMLDMAWLWRPTWELRSPLRSWVSRTTTPMPTFRSRALLWASITGGHGFCPWREPTTESLTGSARAVAELRWSDCGYGNFRCPISPTFSDSASAKFSSLFDPHRKDKGFSCHGEAKSTLPQLQPSPQDTLPFP